MAKTLSSMKSLGTKAPYFSVPDPITGGRVRVDETFLGSPLLVMFICNHCPYVVHVRSELVKLAKEYQSLGVHVVAINSNDPIAYPEDSPEQMKIYAKEFAFTFAYGFDETQDVAKAYDATCTPDFFLFDSEHTLVYRGQMDDSRPNSQIAVTGKDLRDALDAVLLGQANSISQKPSLGCNIKWR